MMTLFDAPGRYPLGAVFLSSLVYLVSGVGCSSNAPLDLLEIDAAKPDSADMGSYDDSSLDMRNPEDAKDDWMMVDSITNVDSEVLSDSGFDANGSDILVADTLDANTVALLPAGLYYYNLASAPFPRTAVPDIAVRVPEGFNPFQKPGVVVFFHGFSNCIKNVIGSVNSPCTTGGPARGSLNLIEQLDILKVNALLVAVEIAYDERSGAVGQLANKDQFRLMMNQLFSEKLAPVLGTTLHIDSIDRLVLSCHSGGYTAVAAVIKNNVLPRLTQVDLHDALYGETTTYDNWVKNNLDDFNKSIVDDKRFADVYTEGGGTASNSRAMAQRVTTWLSGIGLLSSLLNDDTTVTLVPEQYEAPLMFKRSALSHGDVPKYYFQRLIASAGFAPIVK